MMNFQKILFAGLITFLLTSCSKDKDNIDYGLGNFRIDMATVVSLTSGRGLSLDNQSILIPNSTISSKLETGSRVLVNYVVVQETAANTYTVSLNGISAVNSSSIGQLTSKAPDDPMLAEAIWQTGDWLNMRVGFDYFEKKHSIELDQRSATNTDTIYLELRHSKNGDTPGYWVKTYLSYSLKAYARKGKSVPIKLRIKSVKEGVKFFYFDYLSPTQN